MVVAGNKVESAVSKRQIQASALAKCDHLTIVRGFPTGLRRELPLKDLIR